MLNLLDWLRKVFVRAYLPGSGVKIEYPPKGYTDFDEHRDLDGYPIALKKTACGRYVPSRVCSGTAET
jgi:hypothetical protein